jgi:cytochrome c553
MNMARSIWLLATTLASAALIACTGDTINLLPDDGEDDDTEQGGDGSGAGSGDGGSTSTTTPGASAKDFYISSVHDSLAATCNECHATGDNGGPIFMAELADASYNALVGFSPSLIAIPENSNLILHGEHTGPALTAAQIPVVSQWLDMEAEERGLVGGGDDPPPSGPTLQEALQGFADCMSYENWLATGMDNTAASQTQFGDCNGCHAQGEAGYIANKINDMDMFAQSREFPFVKKYVSGTVNENGAFAGLVAANRVINKGLEAGDCDPEIDNCHPVYSLSPTNLAAVEQFVSITMELYENGGCTPQP